MGNTDTKLNFRKAVVELTTKTQPVEASDEAFWNQFWSDSLSSVQDVFTLIPAAEIRALREENPSNLATLCYKAVEKLVHSAETGCKSQRDQQSALNCVRLLTRVLPYIFEDPDWRGFFWSTLPGQADDAAAEAGNPPLAQSLVSALGDLLFCPDFTVTPGKKDSGSDEVTVDSCEYIWEAGVGFAHSPPMNQQHDQNRTEILKLILTCFSETMYLPPVADAHTQPNQWIAFFTSTENRHALPLFTSILNIVCSYDPVGYGLPYNHLMFNDSREPLVEVALQVLCVTLDNDVNNQNPDNSPPANQQQNEVGGPDSLFVNYLSRIHREEDFEFVLKGLTRLLNNPLQQTYLPGSSKKVQFHQELLVLFWKMCDINKKFMFYVLKSSDVLDILVPILFHLNDARADQSRVGLMHIAVFILLLLSGERNFGVRLNKPYTVRVPMDIPVFTGTHADFLIIVFHKIITTGHQRLQPLFDCLLTIIVNVSPYLKTLSMVASTKLLHLLEAFSTPWFLYASPTNHHLVFFLLEVFNNIIQYQFDGNSNLVYTIIRKRNVFHQLANLPTDHSAIAKALSKKGRKLGQSVTDKDMPSMEGSTPAAEAEPGTLKASLADTPALPNLTMHVDEVPPGKVKGDKSSTTSVPLHLNLNDSTILSHETSYKKPTSPSKSKSAPIDTTLGEAFKESKTSRGTNVGDELGVTRCNVKDSKPKLTLAQAARQPSIDQSNEEHKSKLAHMLGIENMTEKSPASSAHIEQQTLGVADDAAESIQPQPDEDEEKPVEGASSLPRNGDSGPEGEDAGDTGDRPPLTKAQSMDSKSGGHKKPTPPSSPTQSVSSDTSRVPLRRGLSVSATGSWVATPEWVQTWKQKLPLQTIMRLLQVLVPQVEKICIDKGLTDESEILKFLQHGTLVGLLPVPHPILIRKYQANSGTTMWFRTYMWGVIYLRNVDPPVWYDTDVKLFEIQRV